MISLPGEMSKKAELRETERGVVSPGTWGRSGGDGETLSEDTNSQSSAEQVLGVVIPTYNFVSYPWKLLREYILQVLSAMRKWSLCGRMAVLANAMLWW